MHLNLLPESIVRRFTLLLVCFANAFSVYSQSNIPGNANAPGAATVSTQSLPGAYSAGIPVNYVRAWQPLKPYTSEADIISSSRLVEEVNRSTQYMDGLGRSLQTVGWQASPDKLDLVAPVVYDEFGHEKYKYLPFATGNTGLLNADPFSTTIYGAGSTDPGALNKIYPGESVFYGQTNYEASPLNEWMRRLFLSAFSPKAA